MTHCNAFIFIVVTFSCKFQFQNKQSAVTLSWLLGGIFTGNVHGEFWGKMSREMSGQALFGGGIKVSQGKCPEVVQVHVPIQRRTTSL